MEFPKNSLTMPIIIDKRDDQESEDSEQEKNHVHAMFFSEYDKNDQTAVFQVLNVEIADNAAKEKQFEDFVQFMNQQINQMKKVSNLQPESLDSCLKKQNNRIEKEMLIHKTMNQAFMRSKEDQYKMIRDVLMSQMEQNRNGVEKMIDLGEKMGDFHNAYEQGVYMQNGQMVTYIISKSKSSVKIFDQTDGYQNVKFEIQANGEDTSKVTMQIYHYLFIFTLKNDYENEMTKVTLNQIDLTQKTKQIIKEFDIPVDGSYWLDDVKFLKKFDEKATIFDERIDSNFEFDQNQLIILGFKKAPYRKGGRQAIEIRWLQDASVPLIQLGGGMTPYIYHFNYEQKTHPFEKTCQKGTIVIGESVFWEVYQEQSDQRPEVKEIEVDYDEEIEKVDSELQEIIAKMRQMEDIENYSGHLHKKITVENKRVFSQILNCNHQELFKTFEYQNLNVLILELEEYAKAQIILGVDKLWLLNLNENPIVHNSQNRKINQLLKLAEFKQQTKMICKNVANQVIRLDFMEQFEAEKGWHQLPRTMIFQQCQSQQVTIEKKFNELSGIANFNFPIVFCDYFHDEIIRKRNSRSQLSLYLDSFKNQRVFFCAKQIIFQSIEDYENNLFGKFQLNSKNEVVYIKETYTRSEKPYDEKMKMNLKEAMFIISPTIFMADDDSSNKFLILLKAKDDFHGSKQSDIVSVHAVIFNLVTEKVVLHQDLQNPFYESKFYAQPCEDYNYIYEFNLNNLVGFEQTSSLQLEKQKEITCGAQSYQLQIRYPSLGLIQMIEFKYQSLVDEKGRLTPQSIEIQGLKLLVLNSNPEVNINYGGFSSLFDEDSNLQIGSSIAFKEKEYDRGLESIDIPNKSEDKMMFNSQELTCSDITKFKYGNLYEVMLTTLVQQRGAKITPIQKYRVLEKQLKVILKMVSSNFIKLLDTDFEKQSNFYDSYFKYNQTSPVEMWGGYPLAKFLVNNPDQIKETLRNFEEIQLPKSKDGNIQSSLARVIGQNPERIQKLGELKLFQEEPPSIDTCMGVDQNPILMQLLKNGDKFSAVVFLKYMMVQMHSEERNQILISCFKKIQDLELFEQVSQMFEIHSEETGTGNYEDSAIKIESHISSVQFKEYLDDELIVKPLTLKHYSELWINETIAKEMKKIDEENFEKSVFRVEHSYIDFTELNQQENIETLADENKQQSKMNHYALSKMLKQMVNQTMGQIGDQKIVRNLIDFQYEKFTVVYTKTQLVIYLIFYFVPLSFVILNSQASVTLTCIISCCSIQALNIGIELIQIKQSSFSSYIQDPWNKVDICFIFLNLAYFANKLMIEDQNIGKEKGFDVILYNVVIITFACLKLIFYVRIFESFGQLIQLLTICMRDISTFIVFLICWILFFGNIFAILEVGFDDGDYSQLQRITIIAIQTYRNSIGDIGPPTYPRWDKMIQSEDAGERFQGHTMITMIWAVWIIHQFMILIIMLNFLIAIISQSYEDVMSKSQIYKYNARVDLNIECLQVMDFLVRLESFDTLLIISQIEEDMQNDQQWQGIVNSIKDFTRQNSKKQRETIEKIFTRQGQETTEKIEVVKQEIGVVKQEIESTKSEIVKMINEIQIENKKEMMEMEKRIIAALQQ